MKKLVLSLIALATIVTANAGPALRRVVKMQQPDGTVVEAVLSGDEFSQVYTDLHSGKVLKTITSDNRPAKTAGSTNHEGECRYPVILIEFEDLKFTNLFQNGNYETIEDLYTDLFNGKSYSFMECGGSVQKYFVDQSYGKYTPIYDVIGVVTLSGNCSQYGSSHPSGAANGIYEALNIAYNKGMISDEQIVSWDNNKDGEVDNVLAVFAGYNEAYCGVTKYIWSHNYNIQTLRLGSSTTAFRAYTCSSELYGAPGSDPVIDGIGTIAHEFSHVLGLPDFYDVNHQKGNEAVYGLDYYSLMDQGCYIRNAAYPSSYTAHERAKMGWLEIEELPLCEDSITVTLPVINDEKKAYIYRNPNNSNEAFIFEYHGKAGWDKYYCNISYSYVRGMLITHLDYNASDWTQNKVNTNFHHLGYTVVPADDYLHAYNNNVYSVTNTQDPEQAAIVYNYRISGFNDLWPCLQASKYKYHDVPIGGPFTSFSKDTSPQAVFYDGTEADFVIENISEDFSTNLITFSLKPYGYSSATTIENLESKNDNNRHIELRNGKISINGIDLLGRKL